MPRVYQHAPTRTPSPKGVRTRCNTAQTMSKTAFLDESKRSGQYLLCCVVTAQSDMADLRRDVVRLAGGHSTIHMNDRNAQERLRFARAIAQAPVQGFILGARERSDRDARDLLLDRVVPHLVELGVTRLVMETCGQDQEDRRILRRALGSPSPMVYIHANKSEPMLALPDILAWAYGRGGKFRAAVGPIVATLGEAELPTKRQPRRRRG